MAIVLGPNQYGKAEVRVVAVDRSSPRHTLVDLNVSSSLRGDFAAAHTAGDNSHVLATDTQKNTIFAFARDGVGTPEEFGLRLARHFAGAYPWITGARVAVESYGWDRIPVGGAAARPRVLPQRRRGADRGGDGGRRRRPRARRDHRPRRPEDHRLGVLGLPARPVHDPRRDPRPDPGHRGHRALAVHDDRGRLRRLATRASGRRCWRPSPRRTHSRCSSPCYAMGAAVLEQFPDIAEIRMSMPNKHHFLQDLSAFGLDNPGRRLPRRRPALRPDRGHRAARRRDARRDRLAGDPRLLLRRRQPASTPMPPNATVAWIRRSAACSSWVRWTAPSAPMPPTPAEPPPDPPVRPARAPRRRPSARAG